MRYEKKQIYFKIFEKKIVGNGSEWGKGVKLCEKSYTDFCIKINGGHKLQAIIATIKTKNSRREIPAF